jgi:predicted nucleic acid-binding protein
VTFLVDSNVISEPTKPSPSIRVVDWLRDNESDLAIDSIVLGELSAGIRSLPQGRKRRALAVWLDELSETVVCLPWDASVALRWGRLVARLRAAGRSMPILDSQIAATALTHDLTIATRNADDFRHAGVKLTNPFGA